MSRRSLLLAGLFGLASAGCATKSDVATLEESMLEEIRQLRADQERLLGQIGLAFDSIGATGRQTRLTQGDMQRGFDELRDQIARVMEMVSQNNQLLNDLYAGRAAAGAGTDPGAVIPVLPGGGEADEATTFYAAAQQQFTRGAYETARGGFEDFLANYPQHQLAPDAQYFLAETYGATGDPVTALAEYARVLELYPDSRRAPTALYKSGMIELERGNLQQARQFFARVEAGYPNSPEAELAREQLRRLGSG